MALIAAHLNAEVILVVTVRLCCLMSTETMRLIRDGGGGGWVGGGIEVGGEGDYIPIATLSPPE